MKRDFEEFLNEGLAELRNAPSPANARRETAEAARRALRPRFPARRLSLAMAGAAAAAGVFFLWPRTSLAQELRRSMNSIEQSHQLVMRGFSPVEGKMEPIYEIYRQGSDRRYRSTQNLGTETLIRDGIDYTIAPTYVEKSSSRISGNLNFRPEQILDQILAESRRQDAEPELREDVPYQGGRADLYIAKTSKPDVVMQVYVEPGSKKVLRIEHLDQGKVVLATEFAYSFDPQILEPSFGKRPIYDVDKAQERMLAGMKSPTQRQTVAGMEVALQNVIVDEKGIITAMLQASAVRPYERHSTVSLGSTRLRTPSVTFTGPVGRIAEMLVLKPAPIRGVKSSLQEGVYVAKPKAPFTLNIDVWRQNPLKKIGVATFRVTDPILVGDRRSIFRPFSVPPQLTVIVSQKWAAEEGKDPREFLKGVMR